MIPQSEAICQTENWRSQSWQKQMIHCITNADALCHFIDLEPAELKLSEQAAKLFPVRVPRFFAEQIETGNPTDPLLLQVLNQGLEDLEQPGFSSDPLNEEQFMAAPGLIHKYHGRALMVVSGKCAINCRYCFRRSFPYEENNPGRVQWQQAFDYIHDHPDLSEIIFSGGDPLSAPDRHLAWLSEQLQEIPHLKRLRIHSRFPVVIPNRICNELIDWLQQSRLHIQLVLHINHPNEVTEELSTALRQLRPLGIHTLNQSVLLKGINDHPDTLQRLQEKAFEAGILPYYIHTLDPIAGAGHFHVPVERARQLIAELRSRLPGYLVPRLAAEIPGASSKTLLG